MAILFETNAQRYWLGDPQLVPKGPIWPVVEGEDARPILRRAAEGPLATSFRATFDDFDGGRACQPIASPDELGDRLTELVGRKLLLLHAGSALQSLAGHADIRAMPPPPADDSYGMKVLKVLGHLPGEIGPALRELGRGVAEAPAAIIEKLREPEVQAVLVVGLALWLEMHAMGVGFAVDAIILGYLLVFFNIWFVFDIVKDCYHLILAIGEARSDADYASCARRLAKILLLIGVVKLLNLLTRVAGRALGKPRGSTPPEIKTAPPKQAAPTPPAAPVEPPPSGIPTINGRKPINSRYAGKTHPSGVKFNDRGFPDFKPHTVAEAKIDNLTGVYRTDAAMANKAMGYPSTPKGYVWHHVEDMKTMQLIPQEIHDAVRHTGGSALFRNGGFD